MTEKEAAELVGDLPGISYTSGKHNEQKELVIRAKTMVEAYAYFSQLRKDLKI